MLERCWAKTISKDLCSQRLGHSIITFNSVSFVGMDYWAFVGKWLVGQRYGKADNCNRRQTVGSAINQRWPCHFLLEEQQNVGFLYYVNEEQIKNKIIILTEKLRV